MPWRMPSMQMQGLWFCGLGSAGNNDFNIHNDNVRLPHRSDNPLEMALFLFRAHVDAMANEVNLFQKLCSFDNLFEAYWNARRHKTRKPYVLEFEKDLQNNLFKLQWEFLTQTYSPHPLTTFTVRDPKTRKISAAHFRDRVVHHALCNIIQPIFESKFIHDTYANRKGKGTLAALKRFVFFVRKVAGNGKPITRERESQIMLRAIASNATSSTTLKPSTMKFCFPFCARESRMKM